MFRTRFSFLALLLLGALGLGEQLQAKQRTKSMRQAPSIQAEQSGSISSKISIGDTLAFRIVEDEDPPMMLKIDEAGQVKVPYLGRVPAAGKTTAELAAEIKRSLERSLYKKATVMIALSRRQSTTATTTTGEPVRSSGRIYLSGEVNKQGPLDLPTDEALTVSRAILRAGGFSEFANRKKVKLIRRTGNTLNTTIVNVATAMDQARRDLDPLVQSGDIIEVPQRLVNW
jgi:protein involved in polysaccharide export with SLBB domain